MLKQITVFIIILTLSLSGFAQKNSSKDDVVFPVDTLEQLLLKSINKLRKDMTFDTLESNAILKSASEIQAKHMAKIGKAELDGESKKFRDTGKRLIASGGSKNGEEVVYAVSVAKGKNHLPVKEAAEVVLKKWKESKKEKPIISNGKYIYYGITAEPDKDGKKVYISLVLSGYNITNDGVKKKTELKVPFTEKNKRMYPPTPVACKNCDKFKDYDSLRAGLYVDDKGFVCMKYYDLKALKRLFKKSTDGLAVDIVPRAQYPPDA